MEKNFRMTLYILPTKKKKKKKHQRIPPIKKKKKKKERKENSDWLQGVWCLSAFLPLPHAACDWGFTVQYYENVILNESFLPFSSVSFSCTH